MFDDVLRWAGLAVESPVVRHAPLTGGMTSTMLALRHEDGTETVLRLMTNEPWRTFGAQLTTRERAAQQALTDTPVPAPRSIALDADGAVAGVATHLMTRLPGDARGAPDVTKMVAALAAIHEQDPQPPFRAFQSWAWEAKRVVPPWTQHPSSWQSAFALLAESPPSYEPTFLHRDFSHRNLLWDGGDISGVVDWVETSTGPAWLDAAHAATNLAVAFGPEPAEQFLADYGASTGRPRDDYWLVMDAVGFLPPPGKEPLFGAPEQLQRLDEWVERLTGLFRV